MNPSNFCKVSSDIALESSIGCTQLIVYRSNVTICIQPHVIEVTSTHILKIKKKKQRIIAYKRRFTDDEV